MNEKFINLRKQIGLSQIQVAEYLGVDQSYISKIEKGERKVSMDVAEKLAILGGYDLSYYESNVPQENLNISFRATSLDIKDLEAIARINEIALNLQFMIKIAAERLNEK